MITGSLVALVTPMHPDGAVDYDALKGLVNWHVGEGTDAIIAVGTTGESATLDMDEHLEVIGKVVEFSAGRVPVLGGTGANSTSEAIELTQGAKARGVDACLLVTPYYNKPPQEGLYQHYRKVAETVDVPIVLYNVPGRTGCDLLPQTVKRLAGVPNIIGLKEAVGDTARVRELLSFQLDGFALYSGDDGTACHAILAGFNGDISVTANVAPKLMHEMTTTALTANQAAAEAVDARLQPLHEALFVEPNPIPVKWALAEMGKIGRGIRLPLVPLADPHHDAVREALRAAGVH